MAELASKFNIGRVIQYYSDQCTKHITNEYGGIFGKGERRSGKNILQNMSPYLDFCFVKV